MVPQPEARVFFKFHKESPNIRLVIKLGLRVLKLKVFGSYIFRVNWLVIIDILKPSIRLP